MLLEDQRFMLKQLYTEKGGGVKTKINRIIKVMKKNQILKGFCGDYCKAL